MTDLELAEARRLYEAVDEDYDHIIDSKASLIADLVDSLKAELATERGERDLVTFEYDELMRLREQLATATDMLKLLGNQMAAAAPVLERAEQWMQIADKVSKTSMMFHVDSSLIDAVTAYRAWLASHPHVEYAGVVSVEGTGKAET